MTLYRPLKPMLHKLTHFFVLKKNPNPSKPTKMQSHYIWELKMPKLQKLRQTQVMKVPFVVYKPHMERPLVFVEESTPLRIGFAVIWL